MERQSWEVVAADRPGESELTKSVDASCVLVGASAGGGVALALASGAPPGVRRVVVIGPLVPDAPVPLDSGRSATLSAAAANGPEAWASAVLADPWYAAGVEDERRRWLGDMLRANAPGGSPRRSWAPPSGLAGRLGQIRAPVTVLLGALDDPANAAMSAFVASNVAGGSLHTVPGSGHLVELAQPEAVAQAIRGEIAPWPDVRSILFAELDRYCADAKLLAAGAPSAIAPWTASQVTAHLAHTFDRFTHLLTQSRAGNLAAPFSVSDLDEVNAAALRQSVPGLSALQASVHRFAAACRDPWEVMAHHRGPISVGLQQALGVSELALHHHDIDRSHRPSTSTLDVLGAVWGSVLGELDPDDDPWRSVLRASGRPRDAA